MAGLCQADLGRLERFAPPPDVDLELVGVDLGHSSAPEASVGHHAADTQSVLSQQRELVAFSCCIDPAPSHSFGETVDTDAKFLGSLDSFWRRHLAISYLSEDKDILHKYFVMSKIKLYVSGDKRLIFGYSTKVNYSSSGVVLKSRSSRQARTICLILNSVFLILAYV